jgi:hypothetical protein
MGDEHPDTLISMNNLGSLLKDQGNLGEAELLLREVLPASRRTLGDKHPLTVAADNNLKELLMMKKRLAEAEPPEVERYMNQPPVSVAQRTIVPNALLEESVASNIPEWPPLRRSVRNPLARAGVASSISAPPLPDRRVLNPFFGFGRKGGRRSRYLKKKTRKNKKRRTRR